jgi:SP family myo-inositol transporter-like MFS transporter 13
VHSVKIDSATLTVAPDYSSTLFDIVGFSNPIAVGSVVAVVNWIFTVLSIFIIDRVGRRRLLL